MIKCYINFVTMSGTTPIAFPPLEWSELESRTKMVDDCKAWLDGEYPDWERAVISLQHHNYIETAVIRNETHIY